MKISNNDSNNSIPWHLALQRLLDLLLRVDHRIHPIQSSLTLPPSHQHCLSALVDLHCENRQYSPQGTRMYKLTASPEILQEEALKFCSEKSRILAPDFWPDRMWKCGHNALNFWGQLPQPIWGAFLGKYAVHITHLSTSFTTLDLGHPWSHWNILIETWSAVAVAVAVGPCCNSNAGAAQASPKRARSPSAAWHVTTGPKGKKKMVPTCSNHPWPTTTTIKPRGFKKGLKNASSSVILLTSCPKKTSLVTGMKPRSWHKGSLRRQVAKDGGIKVMSSYLDPIYYTHYLVYCWSLVAQAIYASNTTDLGTRWSKTQDTTTWWYQLREMSLILRSLSCNITDPQ